MLGLLETQIDEFGEIVHVHFAAEDGALTFTPRSDQRPFPNDAAGKAKLKAKLSVVLELLRANLDKL